MDAARKGIITKEMEAVAKKEYMDIDELVKLVACGKVIIPANKNHKCLEPNGIGSMLRTKINVNLGTSRDCVDLDMELDKVNNAVQSTDDFKQNIFHEILSLLGYYRRFMPPNIYAWAFNDVLYRHIICIQCFHFCVSVHQGHVFSHLIRAHAAVANALKCLII